jgi:GH15 family glucan-1,4-alpha-glucosidase
VSSSLELGVIGNCQIGALIDRRGRNVWTCFPAFDSDPMFCSLLRNDAEGAEQGIFDVELNRFEHSSQTYLRNTAILETILTASDGAKVRVVDFCPRFTLYGRHFRPAMLVRMVEPIAGHPHIRIRLRPRSNYGAQAPTCYLGSHHIGYHGESFAIRVTTNASITAITEERAVVLREPLSFIVGPDEPISESVHSLTRRFYEETRQYWLDWVRSLAIPYEWQEAVIRSAITLKLCTFEDTGAVIAALTTSIPEAADSGRNWDYRYCWLRDSYFTIQAMNRLGATRTMEGYLRYIGNIVAATEGNILQPVYAASGEAALPEEILTSLPGYRGMGPVRVGNQAYEQQQNDVYGAVILASTQFFFDSRLAQPGSGDAFSRLEVSGERCIELFNQPDAGPWEYRGRRRVHTFSSIMCWAGVDHLARIAMRLGLHDRARYWQDHASRLHDEICASAWNEEQRAFTEAWGVDSLDASLLLMSELGFLAADDPRFVGTVNAIEGALRHGPYLFRYNAADDFGRPETAFNVCTFWYINALAAIGRKDEARELFENMLARCNHVGLLSEDLHPQTLELWGNYPQTYSLVGIINSATRLSRPWEDAL